MALFGLGKKSSDEPKPEGKGDGAEPAVDTGFERDARKARAWFDRAKTVSDTGNYDYAIESYISGLKFEPDAMTQHEALRDVSLRRKVNGGKPAGMRDRPPVSGKTALEKMLAAEYRWAKDPDNAGHALDVMTNAVALSRADAEGHLDEVAHWIGQFAIEANTRSKRPSKQAYLRVRDCYAEIGAFDKAVDACIRAVRLDPQNAALLKELRDLQAESTMMQGRYDETDEGDFTKSVRDIDEARKLERSEAIAASEDQQALQIRTLKEEYDADPDDIQKLERLVRVLLQTEQGQQENEAIKLLQKAHASTKQYRYKMQIGDVRMKQFKREIRKARAAIDADADDTKAQETFRTLAAGQAKFELEEYTDRVKNYPTDMSLRFQLGRRQLALKMIDEAIASFQEAQADPKHRGAAQLYLGRAFAVKEWWDEAIDTFRLAIEGHDSGRDQTWLELQYELMNALERKARREKDRAMAEEASKIGSQIAQTNINFKDIRARIESVRGFIDELREAAAG